MNGTPKTKSFLVALIIIIGLIFLNFPAVSSEIKNTFYSIVAPAHKTLNSFAERAKNSWIFFRNLKNIYQENINLKDEISHLQSQNTEFKEIEKENEFLRSYFNLPSRQKYNIELANVSGRDFQGLEKYLLIDKGTADGINKDMPVVVFGNILIGKIHQPYDKFSTVLLITSANSRIPALIQESRAEGLIRGITKDDTVLMELVSEEVEAKAGQLVVTSGIDETFPRGLLIGQIQKVELVEGRAFKDIEIALSVDINKLEQVLIIKD